jgi:hypothetical protein
VGWVLSLTAMVKAKKHTKPRPTTCPRESSGLWLGSPEPHGQRERRTPGPIVTLLWLSAP